MKINKINIFLLNKHQKIISIEYQWTFFIMFFKCQSKSEFYSCQTNRKKQVKNMPPYFLCFFFLLSYSHKTDVGNVSYRFRFRFFYYRHFAAWPSKLYIIYWLFNDGCFLSPKTAHEFFKWIINLFLYIYYISIT